MINIAEFT
jgi:hypothetical protein